MRFSRLLVLSLAVGVLGCSSCSSDKNGPGAEHGGGKNNYWAPPGPSGKRAPLDPSQASATSTTYRAPPESMTIATGHPRLIVREADLARLRSWATADNLLFSKGLDALGKAYAKDMDAGAMSKDTGFSYSNVPHEGYAEVLAFLSLIHPDPATRADYAKRARTLIMNAINQAALGLSEGKPFRDKRFAIEDRARWYGEGFALTVDWIYGSLSAADKATIRKVFLRWSDEIIHSNVTDNDHPEPVGMINDPKLLADRSKVRWATNNYYNGHLRNLGLMSLALDAADDPDEKLRGNLKNVTGAWLYVLDALLRGDMAGGLGAEGFEYSPQALGYAAQLLLALHTSGNADPKTNGPQATFQNPFWDAVIPAFLHSISPVPTVPKDKNYAWKGEMYSVAWYGDGQKFFVPDPMGIFGPMGVYDQLVKNDKQVAQIRWIEANVPAGGAAELPKRAGDTNSYIEPIFTFLLFDPKAPPSPDPRPGFTLTHFAPGLQRILARSSWGPDATWFTYKLGWNAIDHQHSDGNMFEIYRKGEWLTKERTGYGQEVACSDHKNTITIQNNPAPFHNEGYRALHFKHGSQWPYVAGGDGKLLATSFGPKHVYALGDATELYNSDYEHSVDVAHVSRSIVWLNPDRVVIYDRVASKTDNRFKRFFVNLTGEATTANGLTSMTSPGGQKLYVRTLLPVPATIVVEPGGAEKETADMDPNRFRLKVEAPGNPKSTRFLHYIQAADGGTAAEAAAAVRSNGGTPYEGLIAHDTVVLFPVDVGPAVTKVSWPAPASAKVHFITGLQANTGYTVTTKPEGVSIEAGGETKTDSGGVLVIGQL